MPGRRLASFLPFASFLILLPSLCAQPAPSFCAERTVTIRSPLKTAWNGWSPSPTNTRFQDSGAAGLTVDQVRRLRVIWAFGFQGDTIVFAQPSVVGNNLFVGSASGKVHALDAQSGCTRWTFQAESAVRPAIVIAPLRASGNALLFGDRSGWFYSLEAETGRLLWKKKIDDHAAARVTGAAVAQDGVVYVPVASAEETSARGEKYACCSFRGSVVALRVQDGSQVWKTYMIAEEPRRTGVNPSGVEEWGPSGAGVWSAPTLDTKRGLLYVTTGDNYSQPATPMSDAVVALEMKTGRIVWSQQTIPGDVFNGNCQQKNTCPGPDYDFGSSLILERLANRDFLLAGQKSGLVYALDPDKKGRLSGRCVSERAA